jgi:hypothetical protein
MYAQHTKAGHTTTFPQMITNLFKPMDGVGARMMHACIGMAGESSELRNAFGRKHVIEEFGDLEFYIEAAWQELPEGTRMTEYSRTRMFAGPAFGDIVNDIHIETGNLLDYAKKVWVYGGSKGDRNSVIAEALVSLEGSMQAAYEMLGLDRIEVQAANMDKLLGTADSTGRYESGSYSDEQALARADKSEPAPDPVDHFKPKLVTSDKQK